MNDRRNHFPGKTIREELIAEGLPVKEVSFDGTSILFTRPLSDAEKKIYKKIVNPGLFDRDDAFEKIMSLSRLSTIAYKDIEPFFEEKNLTPAGIDALQSLAEFRTAFKVMVTVLLEVTKLVVLIWLYISRRK